MKYDFFTLSLLSSLERYLPYMSDEDLREILEYGMPPSPWKIRAWEAKLKAWTEKVDDAIRTAMENQK